MGPSFSPVSQHVQLIHSQRREPVVSVCPTGGLWVGGLKYQPEVEEEGGLRTHAFFLDPPGSLDQLCFLPGMLSPKSFHMGG